MIIHKYKEFINEYNYREKRGLRVVTVKINNRVFDLKNITKSYLINKETKEKQFDSEEAIKEAARLLEKTIFSLKADGLIGKSLKAYFVLGIVFLLKEKKDYGSFKDIADLKNSLGQLKNRMNSYLVETAAAMLPQRKLAIAKTIYDNIKVGGDVYQVTIKSRKDTKKYEEIINILFEFFNDLYSNKEEVLLHSYIYLYSTIKKR